MSILGSVQNKVLDIKDMKCVVVLAYTALLLIAEKWNFHKWYNFLFYMFFLANSQEARISGVILISSVYIATKLPSKYWIL